MATFKTSGLDDLQKDLKKLSGKRKVSFDKLFTPAFMRKYTRFRSIDALLEAGGFHADTNAAFDAIPQRELDAHIAKVTKFRNWEAMLEEAAAEYVLNQLDF